ncbi:MAG: MlaD family protein [candidate division WOR-3 bacterium]
MNRRVREILVTIFVLLGIFLGVFGYFWFGGRLFPQGRRLVKVYFSDVSGLRVGDRVDVLGITKGRIVELKLMGNGVLVKLAIDRDVRLTENARFAIRSLSYLGSDRYLTVTPGEGAVVADTFTFNGVNEVLDLESTFLRLDRLLGGIDPALLSAELRHTRDELLRLVNSRLRGLDSGFGVTAANIQRLSIILDTLTQLLGKESTAKKLLSSPELYEELLKTNRQLQEFITDIKAHPERYFRLKLF